jgi:hypothetical protein
MGARTVPHAARAHADAPALEVRYGGVDILADRARTTTASQRACTSARRSHTVPSSWTGKVSPATAAPSWLRHERTRSRPGTQVRSPSGPRSMTATRRWIRWLVTAAHPPTWRRALTSLTRSTAAVTTSALPSTWPGRARGTRRDVRSCAGPAHPIPGSTAGCRAHCGEACTEVRRT